MPSTHEEIRKSVAASYGSRVRPVLEAEELRLPVVAAASCCAPAESEASSCCGPDESSAEVLDRIADLYSGSNLQGLPESVTSVAFGCGNPTAIDALQPGETVVDLGSGGGIDCFLAARMVGPSGNVIGIDMTEEMIGLANKNLAKVGATNVEFRRGQIESLPVEDVTADVIISNCVINLSPDKDQVFREAFRVLKPGGRLQVSDMVWLGPAPNALAGDAEAWAGCVGGAIELDDYEAKIRGAGFEAVTSAVSAANEIGLASANVMARKPMPTA